MKKCSYLRIFRVNDQNSEHVDNHEDGQVEAVGPEVVGILVESLRRDRVHLDGWLRRQNEENDGRQAGTDIIKHFYTGTT